MPVPDPKMLTSSFRCCENSPDFCGKEDLMMYCSTCKGNSHDCTNLHMHLESFSAQPVPTNTGILPHDLEKAILPLEFKTYQNLFKYSSLIKILRILTLNSYMKSLLSEEFEASAVNPLTKVAVLLQPKCLSKIRKFKPSQENLKKCVLSTSQI